MKRLVPAAALSFVLLSALNALPQNRSVYTSLSSKSCRELKATPAEGAEYEGVCPGVGGYRLYLLEGDLRQSVDVMTPAKKRFQLGFWNISGAFSHLGDKAEWRLKGRAPVALIVRFNTQEDPDDPKKIKSSLVVAKVSAGDACVTDVVEPMAKQNETARKLADEASNKPCKYARE